MVETASIYVTKFALTRGIVLASAIIQGDYARVPTGDPFKTHNFGKGDWHRDPAKAVAAARAMAERRATQLRREAQRLDDLGFPVPE